MISYGLRENPKRSFRMADPEFSSSIVQDRESETESSPAAINRRHNKRGSPESLSSVSNSPEAEVAISLMLLSRDFWSKEKGEEIVVARELKKRSLAAAAKGRSGFQCGICKKVFRSYQALGGHRASHKKSGGCVAAGAEGLSEEANAGGEGKSGHVCPICFRQFSSGQALGGHKRSHLFAAAATTTTVSKKIRESLFDLNLPAEPEDVAELSAVSEAEFMNSSIVLAVD